MSYRAFDVRVQLCVRDSSHCGDACRFLRVNHDATGKPFCVIFKRVLKYSQTLENETIRCSTCRGAEKEADEGAMKRVSDYEIVTYRT